MIDFDNYQEKVKGFMNPKVLENSADTFLNSILGLGGEVGEMQDAIKKAWYHEGELDLEKLDKEAGDVLFYITLYCISRNRQLSDIAQLNVDKLNARYEGKPWSAVASKAKKDEFVIVCEPGTISSSSGILKINGENVQITTNMGRATGNVENLPSTLTNESES